MIRDSEVFGLRDPFLCLLRVDYLQQLRPDP